MPTHTPLERAKRALSGKSTAAKLAEIEKKTVSKKPKPKPKKKKKMTVAEQVAADFWN